MSLESKCNNCEREILKTPATVSIYTANLKPKVYDSFCSHYCNRKFIETEIEKDILGEKTLVYTWELPIGQCDFCGSLAHPNEFCETDKETVERYTEKFLGNGNHSVIQGKVVSVFLAPSHELVLQQATLKGSMFDLTSAKIGLDLFQDRVMLPIINGDYQTIRNFIGDETPKETLEKKIVTDFKIRVSETPKSSLSNHFDYVFQIAEKISGPELLFAPYDITANVLFFPAEEYQVENETVIYNNSGWGDGVKSEGEPLLKTFESLFD
jgi:hypothetical protein